MKVKFSLEQYDYNGEFFVYSRPLISLGDVNYGSSFTKVLAKVLSDVLVLGSDIVKDVYYDYDWLVEGVLFIKLEFKGGRSFSYSSKLPFNFDDGSFPLNISLEELQDFSNIYFSMIERIITDVKLVSSSLAVSVVDEFSSVEIEVNRDV